MKITHSKISYKILYILLLLLTGQGFCQSQNTSSQIDTLMNFMHNKYHFDGVVLAASGEKIIYQNAFGFANREWMIKNSMDTKFRLGSMSKQFTSFIIIKLAEDNLLNLNDKISKYLDIFKSPDKKNIKIRNLLTHTSGLYDYTSIKELIQQITYPHDSILNMIALHTSDFEPGTKYEYSNSNFYVLACLAEKVSGKNFVELLNEKILIPSGMKNTGEDNNRKILHNRASPYMKVGNSFSNGPFIEMDNTMGGGGLYSTAGDLFKWSLFLQKQLKSDMFLRSEIKPFRLSDSTLTSYSCGWFLQKGTMLHQGHIGGFAGQILIDTVNNNTVILLSNDNFLQLFVTAKTILNLLNGKKDAMKWLNPLKSNSLLAKYEGLYVHRKDTVTLKAEGGFIFSYYKNQIAKWIHSVNDDFFCENFEGNVFFEKNENNKIIGVKSLEDYNLVEYKKIPQ